MGVAIHKTKYILFHKRLNIENLSLFINNEEISPSEVVKFLGTHFDQKLTWHAHVEATKNKATKACNLLKAFAGTSWGAHPCSLLKIYKGYVRAILEWSNTC